MPVPLIVPAGIGIVSFLGGFFTGSKTKNLLKWVAIGGVVYFLVVTPSGKKLVKKVIG